MATANLSTVSAVVIEIGNRLNEDTGGTLVWERYVQWFNMGMQDIASQIESPWLETSAVLTLADGTRTWQTSSIASDVDQIYNIKISAQEANVKFVTPEQMDLIDPQPSDKGVPRLYTVYNDEITFYPTADSNYGAQVRYFKDVTTVSTSSAVHEVPLKYLETPIIWCVLQGLYKREDFQQAQVMEARYRVLVDRIKKDVADKSKEIKRMLDIREIQKTNKASGDEIVRMFWS